MRKKPLWKFLCVLSVIFAAAFLAAVGWDWHTYTTTLNSAPFRIFLLVRCVEFLLPAAAFFLWGAVLRREAYKK